MQKEIKIILPPYKIAYALFFVVILSLIRGISISSEIGIALEPAMAILAAAFCADTYVQEVGSRRSEIWRLYPMKKRIRSIGMRMLIQELFLLFLATAGYGLFFLFQKPLLFRVIRPEAGSEFLLFGQYLAAVTVTLVFWGVLSNTLACLFRSLWLGIGGCLILWFLTNSASASRYLGSWNIFSYTFRNVDDPGNLSWLMGKCICMIFCITAAAMLPSLIKKRG